MSRLMFALLFLISTSAVAENWPQWRGPSGNGVSSERDLPVEWAPNQNIAWRVPLSGLGTSSPIVWGGRVFVTSQIGEANVRRGSHPNLARDDQALAARENALGGRNAPASPVAGDEVSLVVEAFRVSDGKREWKHSTPATGELPELHEKHNLATPTPATDGTHVYAWFGNGQVMAMDMEGKLLWERHIGEEYAPFHNRWGHGSSPVLYRDLLILLCDHLEASYILALDKRTGKERWMIDRGEGRVSHSTPLIVPGPEGDEMIVNSSERIDVLDPLHGETVVAYG